ncbi:MAG: cob(I)yrinic acid a,c-diamide adenosyltransferase [Rhodospirillales bacterium]|nr:cob(I)yrinic acid a,c-diamide adenosyltransferase [Rhodospirillales bacterium]
MVRIDRVVTRGGDRGETSLGDGSRLAKDAPRIGAIGAVDEANAAIGVLRAALAGGEPDADAALARIQNDLFDLGADLSVPGEGGARLRMSEAPVERLEAEIAAMNAALPPLASFVLPGGRAPAAAAHMARTTVRRAERDLVALVAREAVTPAALRYLNRLSDHMFVLARVLNDRGRADIAWVPGANR